MRVYQLRRLVSQKGGQSETDYPPFARSWLRQRDIPVCGTMKLAKTRESLGIRRRLADLTKMSEPWAVMVMKEVIDF
jgi:hypothetical protein